MYFSQLEAGALFTKTQLNTSNETIPFHGHSMRET